MSGVVETSSRIFLSTVKRPFRTILIRAMTFVVVVLVVSTLLWFTDRDGLKATNKPEDYELTPTDMVYFTVVTLVTVGYGDIVPVTQKAKVIDTLIITPGRIAVWLLFIGTAYEFIFQQYRERFHMRRNKKRLKGHVIVCGFSSIGRFVVKELLAKMFPKKQIVIVSNDEEDCEAAANEGFVTLIGDATREEVLKDALIDRAAYIIVTTGRDDTNILASLTARDLNPTLTVVVRANEGENVKLLRRSGADVIVNPNHAGGNLMAAATRRPHAADMLEDLLSSQTGVDIDERPVRDHEIGKHPKELRSIVVIGVLRNNAPLELSALDTATLAQGDVIVYLREGDDVGTATRHRRS